MAGLPGAGKSMIVTRLVEKQPALVISTDHIRIYLRKQPTYSPAERALVYELCYDLIARRLQAGQRVIFDGSNFLASRRERLRIVAHATNAPVAVCVVQAAESVIQRRLLQRNRGQRRDGDLSEADLSVYQWMVEAQEPVSGEHLILDSTETSAGELADRLLNYWQQCEANTTSEFDLQSTSWSDQFGDTDHTSG
jgi:predicted kinase